MLWRHRAEQRTAAGREAELAGAGTDVVMQGTPGFVMRYRQAGRTGSEYACDTATGSVSVEGSRLVQPESTPAANPTAKR